MPCRGTARPPLSPQSPGTMSVLLGGQGLEGTEVTCVEVGAMKW